MIDAGIQQEVNESAQNPTALFTVTAHQEMFASVDIEAADEQEARSKFLQLLEQEKIQWQIGDDECEIDEVERSGEIAGFGAE